MKLRTLLIALGAAVLLALLYYTPASPPPKLISPSQRAKQAEMIRRYEPKQSATVAVAPPVVPPVQPIRVPAPQPQQIQPTRLVVPIQDQATIDFSIGAPVVRSGGADTEAMEKALQQMEEATRDLQFVPKKKN